MTTYRVLDAVFRVSPDEIPYNPFQGSLVDDIVCDLGGLSEDGACDVVEVSDESDDFAMITFDIEYDGDADELRDDLHESFSNHTDAIGLDEGFEILFVD